MGTKNKVTTSVEGERHRVDVERDERALSTKWGGRRDDGEYIGPFGSRHNAVERAKKEAG